MSRLRDDDPARFRSEDPDETEGRREARMEAERVVARQETKVRVRRVTLRLKHGATPLPSEPEPG